MKYLLELDHDTADKLLIAMLKDSIVMHRKGNKKFRRKPDEDERKYLEAARIVIRWYSPTP